MRIWIDILTPKQLLFTEAIVERLGKKHDILCTSRRYNEVTRLAHIRNFDLIIIGKHGGNNRKSKLDASIDRMKNLSKKITIYSPNVTISYCSPEAARISFGLGIKHVAFCDSPHAEAVMKLTLPLIQKLLIPNIIPKNAFSKFGIDKKNIIPYNAIDAFVTIKRKQYQTTAIPFNTNSDKNILIRAEEEEASYTTRSSKLIPIINQIIMEYKKENIIILTRYEKQMKNLQKKFKDKAIVIKMSHDGKQLLNSTNIFIGSGGTMTAESALMGIPTISYNAVPNIIEDHLVKKKLIKRETDPKKISKYIKKIFSKSTNIEIKKRAKQVTKDMNDPIKELTKIIKK